MRSRRSLLSVPASQPRLHEKAESVPADEVMFDLEDSVAPAAKERSRRLVVAALTQRDYGGRIRAVRVNPCDTRWCADDIREVVEGAGHRLDSVVLPKVEGEDHVHFAHHLLSQLEWKLGLHGRIALEVQIESPRGLEGVERIAASSDRCQALIFGPGDFAAAMRMPGLTVGAPPDAYPGDFWHYFMARILVSARAHGLQAIDGPYAQIRDEAGLRRLATRSALLGYDGKWALNPAQVDVINSVFTPAQADFDRASAIVDAYSRASDVEETGVVLIEGEMVDEATRKLALATVERGRAAGMTAAGSGPA